jgi:hypothetical protein
VKPKSWTPWLVALACFGPFFLAAFLYYGPWADRVPQLSGSRELLTAPVALPSAWGPNPAHPWQLIYARMSPCELPCASDLGRLLQVQLALAGDQEHVERVVWHVGDLPALEDPTLRVQSLEDPVASALVAALGAEHIGDGRVFVADPFGNVILSYPPDIEQKELLRDLKRLLRGAH